MFRLSGRFVSSCLAATGLFAGLGCFGPTKKADPLNLNPDLKTKLNANAGPGPTGGTKPATFDPTQTGASGLTMQNSFGRTKPELASSKLPPPQLKSTEETPKAPMGMAPETSSMAMKPIAAPTESAPMSPKLAVPSTEPPVTRTNYIEAAAPMAPSAMAPLPPMAGALPIPSMGPSLDAPVPLPPPPPNSIPIPKPAPGMSTLPSPVEVPIPGLEPIKLPSAPPIRPN